MHLSGKAMVMMRMGGSKYIPNISMEKNSKVYTSSQNKLKLNPEGPKSFLQCHREINPIKSSSLHLCNPLSPTDFVHRGLYYIHFQIKLCNIGSERKKIRNLGRQCKKES